MTVLGADSCVDAGAVQVGTHNTAPGARESPVAKPAAQKAISFMRIRRRKTHKSFLKRTTVEPALSVTCIW